MKRFILALTAASQVLLFAACGQSGSLYLPGDPSTIQNAPTAPDGAEEEDAEEEEQEDSEAPQG